MSQFKYKDPETLEGKTTVTFQCAVAANPEFDEDDLEHCGHEPEEIELDEPVYLDDRGRIHLPGRPVECPECKNPNQFVFDGVTVMFQ